MPAADATAAQPAPGRISGIVLFAAPDTGLLVYDNGQIVTVHPAAAVDASPGDRIHASGQVDASGSGVRLLQATVARAGRAPLPAGEPLSTALADSDRGDDAWIELRGVVRGVAINGDSAHLRFFGSALPFTVRAPASAVPAPEAIVDAELRIPAVRQVLRNEAGLFVGVRLLSPGFDETAIAAAPPAPPFELPLQPAVQVRSLTARRTTEHRLHVHGVVAMRTPSLQSNGEVAWVQDDSGGIAVETVDGPPLAVGDRVDVAGFPTLLYGSPFLSDAAVRVLGHGAVPPARAASANDLITRPYAGELVTVSGSFVDYSSAPGARVLSMTSGGLSVTAYLYGLTPEQRLPDLVPGAAVELTGVAAPVYGPDGAPQSLVLVMPGPEAIGFDPPSWWTVQRLAVAALIIGGIGALAFVWVGILNARVRRQTRALAEQYERTAATERRWSELVASASDVILTWDCEGRLLSINKTGEALTGLDGSAIGELTLRDIAAPQSRAIAEQLMQSSADAPPYTCEFWLNGARGDATPLEMSVQPMLDNRRHLGFQAIGRDVAAHKETEAALRAARDAAEDASRAKSEFLANMSHEIRTPMNGILGMTELALGGELTDTQREQLELIKCSAESLLGLLNGILDFSKIESRKIELESVPFTVRELMTETVAPLALKAEQKGLTLRLDVDEALSARLVGDPLRLRQIVTNLVSNALKFTHRGTISVHVQQRSIEGSRTTIHVSVRDTGTGIPHDKQALVFEPFSQADGSITRRYGGTGLGLAISASLVKLMNGRIWLESDPGAGSTFHFTATLGIAPASVDTEPARTPAIRPAGDKCARPLKILLAEDNVVNQKVAVGLLSRRGHTVHVVSTGLAAIVALEQDHFDLVLMDVQMPVLGGLEATAEIRRREAGTGRHLRIIAMTAHSMNGDREQCLAAGMDEYVSKPVNPAALFAAVEAVGAPPSRAEDAA